MKISKAQLLLEMADKEYSYSFFKNKSKSPQESHWQSPTPTLGQRFARSMKSLADFGYMGPPSKTREKSVFSYQKEQPKVSAKPRETETSYGNTPYQAPDPKYFTPEEPKREKDKQGIMDKIKYAAEREKSKRDLMSKARAAAERTKTPYY
jgi:hypothetical protein